MHYDQETVPTKTGKSTQVVIRLENDLFKRLDDLVQKLSPAGMPLPRSTVLHNVIERGVEALEGEHGIKAKKPAKK